MTFGLGDVIRKLREQHGWTLRQLTAKSGAAYTAIGRIENGSDNFDLKTLQKIATALGTTPAELLQHAEPVFLTHEQRAWLAATPTDPAMRVLVMEALSKFVVLDPSDQQNFLALLRNAYDATRPKEHAATERSAPVNLPKTNSR